MTLESLANTDLKCRGIGCGCRSALGERRRESVIDLVGGVRSMRRLEGAFSLDARETVRARARDDRPVGLCDLAIEFARRLHHEAAGLVAERARDALHAHESRGLLVHVAHQPDDAAVAAEVAGELLGDLRLAQLRAGAERRDRLLVPVLYLEGALCALLHVLTSAPCSTK